MSRCVSSSHQRNPIHVPYTSLSLFPNGSMGLFDDPYYLHKYTVIETVTVLNSFTYLSNSINLFKSNKIQ